MIWPSVIELGEAAAGHHEDQRGDDRLDADAGDQDAVPQRRAPGPEPSASATASEHAADAVLVAELADAQAGQRAGDRHDRADRQVDAAGRDDQRHAERDQDQRRARAAGCRSGCRRGGRRAPRWRRSPAGRTTLASSSSDQDGGRPEQAGAGSRPGGRSCWRSARDGLHDAVGVDVVVVGQLGRPAAGRAARAILWLSRSTSSSSAEMNSTAMPPSESSTTSRWISALAPTSMPRVGSSRISSRGSVISQRASSTFCWLPPLRLRTGSSGSAGRMLQRLDVLVDQLVLAPPGQRPGPAAGGLQREDDVLPHREVLDEALGAAVLGAERDVVAHGRARACASATGRAVDLDRARGRRGRRRRAAGRARCGRSRAGRPGRPPRRGGWPGRTARSRPCGPGRRPRRRGGSPRSTASDRLGCSSSRSSASSSLPIILRDQLELGQVAGGVLADQAAVAQHRHPVGDLVDLVEEVRDEQDRHALVLSWRMTRNSWATSSASRLEVGSSRISTLAEMSHRRRRDRHHLLHRDRVGAEQRASRRCRARAGRAARRARRRISPQRIRPNRRGSRPMKMFSATDRFGQRLTSW